MPRASSLDGIITPLAGALETRWQRLFLHEFVAQASQIGSQWIPCRVDVHMEDPIVGPQPMTRQEQVPIRGAHPGYGWSKRSSGGQVPVAL